MYTQKMHARLLQAERQKEGQKKGCMPAYTSPSIMQPMCGSRLLTQSSILRFFSSPSAIKAMSGMFFTSASGMGSPASLHLYVSKSVQKHFVGAVVNGVSDPVTMAAGVAHRALAFDSLSTVVGSMGGVQARLANRMLSVSCTWSVYGMHHIIW
jgi:hypothetical protein